MRKSGRLELLQDEYSSPNNSSRDDEEGLSQSLDLTSDMLSTEERYESKVQLPFVVHVRTTVACHFTTDDVACSRLAPREGRESPKLCRSVSTKIRRATGRQQLLAH